MHAFDGARLTFDFPSWSLSAEMFCYLLFPLAAMTVSRSKVLIFALIAVPAITMTVYAHVAGDGSWAHWINQGGAFRALPAFALGIACHLYREKIARWPALPGAVTILLVAYMLLGSLLPEMVDLVIIYGIAVLAIQCDCTGRATTLTGSASIAARSGPTPATCCTCRSRPSSSPLARDMSSTRCPAAGCR